MSVAPSAAEINCLTFFDIFFAFTNIDENIIRIILRAVLTISLRAAIPLRRSERTADLVEIIISSRRQSAVCFLLALALTVTAGASADEASCATRCVQVKTTVSKLSAYGQKIALTGAVEPRYSTNVAFRVGGKIAERLVEIGDHVNADQILARLDPQEQKANLDSAKAALDSVQALLVQAKANFDRQDTLYKKGFATRPSYDQAVQELQKQASAVESAKAAVGNASEQFAYTNLKAGVAGIITGRSAEAGQVVQAGQTVFALAQDGPRDAVFDLYETLTAQPPPKSKVEIYLESDPRVTSEGLVREISPTVDQSKGTVKVKVGLDRVPDAMSLGSSVVGVGTLPSRDLILLPRGALFRWHHAPAVWRLDPQTSKVTPNVIQVDLFTGNEIVVSHGIEPGDTIVTAGIQFLSPGQIVAVANGEPSL